MAIYNAIVTARSSKYDALTDSKINLITKGVQIPAYIFHFVLGCLGLTLSVWGIGVIIFAVVVDFLSILTTGISAIGLHVRMAKDGVLEQNPLRLAGLWLLSLLLRRGDCFDRLRRLPSPSPQQTEEGRGHRFAFLILKLSPLLRATMGKRWIPISFGYWRCSSLC